MAISAYKSRFVTISLMAFIVVAMGLGIYQGVRAQNAGTAQALEQQLYFSRTFEEPLVPMRPTSAAEDQALLHAVDAYKTTRQPADFDAIQVFLKRYPRSAWRVALLTNEGLVDYRAGYFDRAIAAYGEAWQLGKDVTGAKRKALVDRAFGELVRMHSRLGHAHRLAELLQEIHGRAMTSLAVDWVSNAKAGLYEMRHNPGIAYLCGPMAVKNVLLALHPGSSKAAVLDAYRSGPHGVDLATVAHLATKVGLDYRMAYRKSPGTNLPLPAIVHWRVNHYAAVVGFTNGRYIVMDPTFGDDGPLLITPAVLAAESDGYYLIPADDVSAGWATVSHATAKSIYGMGLTNSSNNNATTSNDPCACGGSGPIGSSGHSGSPGPSGSGNGGNGGSDGMPQGMPQADALAMLVSLRITDMPLSYTPPVGPPINITLTYNQKDITQPENFDYGNLGPLWGMNWISYIEDNPQNASANVTHVYGGGGQTVVTGCGNWTCTLSPDFYGYVLSRNGSGIYKLTYPDGSTDTYSLDESEGSSLRRIFLTQVADPEGNAVTLQYDAQYRLTSLTDALGQVTTFHYDAVNDPLQIASVTDPFGRTAIFTYSSGYLASITDEIGQTSTFAYGNALAADFINTMTTPYGTSSFAYDEGTHQSPNSTYYDRWLTLTDPLGYLQRVEYDDAAPGTGSGTDPQGCPPAGQTGFQCTNTYLQYRDTYYWSANNPYNASDYTTAKNFHWLHQQGATNETSRAIESLKLPLENGQPLQNRIWYNYPGQPSDHQSGSLALPSYVALKLSSNVGQISQYRYNTNGTVTCYIDPVGRITRYLYAGNNLDITAVQQVTGGNSCTPNTGGYDTIAQYTYNGQHKPLTYTDAAGQTTTYTYNAAGQLATVTDPLSEITTYNYQNGYLQSVTGPDGQTLASFTYDAMGRVATATDAGGETLGYAWDNLNRLTSITYPDGTVRQYGYDRLDLHTVTDRLGHTTTYGYDADRNLATITDARGKQTVLGYDGDRNLTSLTDPNGHTTTWVYDLADRLISKTYADSSGDIYVYTPEAGWLDHATDPAGQTTEYGYTTDGRVNSISYLNAQVATPAVGFTYDPYYPRVTAMTDGTGTTGYSYYPAGQLGGNKLQTATVPSPSAIIAYAYDALGRAHTRRIDSDTETYDYDVLGRLSTDHNALANFAYSYLGETDQVTSVTPDAGPFSVTYQYLTNTDDRRLKAVLNQALGGAQDPQSFNYQTNAEDLVTASNITRGGSTVQGFSYGYDSDNRLTGVTTGGTSTGYFYDDAGNLQNVIASGPTVLFHATYNALNQIIKANNVNYSYDTTGELVNDGTNTYAWDGAHRLASVTNIASDNVTSYTYDGLGRRVAISTHPRGGTLVTAGYLWCGQALCQARDSNNNVTAKYFAEGEQQGSTALLYGRDRLGSVTDLVASATGFVRASYAYDPWGNITSSSGSYSASFGYAGMFNDSSTSMNLTLYRAYNPAQYRWLSRDPYGERGDPNLYRYVFDNPTNAVDPYGLIILYGWFCGPDWTGGFDKQWDQLTLYQQHHARPPIDALDSACKSHDICYAHCREGMPCDPQGRATCFKLCDTALVNAASQVAVSQDYPWWNIYNRTREYEYRHIIAWYMERKGPRNPEPNAKSCPNC